MIIIIGAAVGALVLGNPKHVLGEMLHQMRKIVTHKKQGSEFQRQLLLLMYELLQTAAGGLKALDAHVEAPRESALFQRYPLVLEEPKLLAFIVDNFRLMAMGKINAHELEGVLEQELEAITMNCCTVEVPAQDRRSDARFGILAAVLGIVMAMNPCRRRRCGGNFGKVGAAMVGTFIGIFFCYACSIRCAT